MKPLVLGLLIFCAANLRAAATLEAFGELAPDRLDEFGDTVGGIGSGICYDAKNDNYLCVTDSGPSEEGIQVRPSYTVLKILQDGKKLVPTVVKTIRFHDEKGRKMSGLAPEDSAAGYPTLKDGTTCMDSEAIAIAPDGTIYVSEEYGPLLYQFQADGTLIRRITLPEEFRPKTADGKIDYTREAKLVSGREFNRGGESMCILPDGKSAAIIFESGLIQDGRRQSPTTRFLILDLATGKATAEYAYPFTDQGIPQEKISVNDMTALKDGRFLVLERDDTGRHGAIEHKPAGYKAVWVTDISHATNILGQSTDKAATPATKQLLFNLPALVPDANTLAANWEGVTVVPPEENGQVTVMMSADNNYLTPIIHEGEKEFTNPKAEESVPTQFAKVTAPLPAP